MKNRWEKERRPAGEKCGGGVGETCFVDYGWAAHDADGPQFAWTQWAAGILNWLLDACQFFNSTLFFFCLFFFVKSLELQKWIIWPCFTGQCSRPSEKSREWGTCWSWTSWYFRLLWWVFHILCPLFWSALGVCFLSHHWSLPKFHLSVPKLIVMFTVSNLLKHFGLTV